MMSNRAFFLQSKLLCIFESFPKCRMRLLSCKIILFLYNSTDWVKERTVLEAVHYSEVVKPDFIPMVWERGCT